MRRPAEQNRFYQLCTVGGCVRMPIGQAAPCDTIHIARLLQIAHGSVNIEQPKCPGLVIFSKITLLFNLRGKCVCFAHIILRYQLLCACVCIYRELS